MIKTKFKDIEPGEYFISINKHKVEIELGYKLNVLEYLLISDIDSTFDYHDESYFNYNNYECDYYLLDKKEKELFGVGE